MRSYHFFIMLVSITAFPLVSSECSTAAELEQELKKSTETPSNTKLIYGSDDIKWNCSNEYDKNTSSPTPAEFPSNSNINGNSNTYRSSFLSELFNMDNSKESITYDSIDNSMDDTSLQRNSRLNTFILIHNKIFKPINDNNTLKEELIPSSHHPSARASLTGQLLETDSLQPTSFVEDSKLNFSSTRSNEKSVKLLLGTEHGITILNVTHPDQSLGFPSDNLTAYDIDYDYSEGILVFTGEGQIRSTEEPKVVAAERVDGPVRIAVDWLHDKVYWMVDKYKTVEMANLNGTDRLILSERFTNFSFPNNIVVDPKERFIFLVANHQIYRASLDFKDLRRITFHDNVKKGVRVIAIDRQSKRIYFTGRVGSTSGNPYIASSDYSGGLVSFHNLSKDIWSDIYSLDVFDNVVFFAHHEPNISDTLWKLNVSKSDGRPERIFSATEASGGVYKIRVFDAGVQMENCNCHS